MAQIELFHGSRVLVEKPQLTKCRPFNDYGPAFYCTESLELAKEWACNLGEDGIANCYRLELDGLALLDLNAPQYCILHCEQSDLMEPSGVFEYSYVRL